MSSEHAGRPDASMTLITEMMERPLDPGYAAAAQSRQESGLPPSTGHRSPMLITVAVLIGAMLAISALALRAPNATVSQIKSDLVGRIESRRAHADDQTRVIDTLRRELDTAQAAALSQQSQTGLAAELARLEIAAGTVPVTGPGLVLTVDDAEVTADSQIPDVDPRSSTEPDDGKIVARDLQIIVNGLWEAGAEAMSVNGHRLTSRGAIRFAGEAILVSNRPLTRPYVITAIGDPDSLSVEFADNSGGALLQLLKSNLGVPSSLQDRDSVVVPGAPALSLREARPVQSAVTKQTVTKSPTAESPTSGPQSAEQPATAARTSPKSAKPTTSPKTSPKTETSP